MKVLFFSTRFSHQKLQTASFVFDELHIESKLYDSVRTGEVSFGRNIFLKTIVDTCEFSQKKI